MWLRRDRIHEAFIVDQANGGYFKRAKKRIVIPKPMPDAMAVSSGSESRHYHHVDLAWWNDGPGVWFMQPPTIDA